MSVTVNGQIMDDVVEIEFFNMGETFAADIRTREEEKDGMLKLTRILASESGDVITETDCATLESIELECDEYSAENLAKLLS